MTNLDHSGRISLSTVAGGIPHTARAASEVLFLDPGVPDIATILGNLRPGVEAIVLDQAPPPARQMAAVLAGTAISTPSTSSPMARPVGCASPRANGRSGRSKTMRGISPQLGGRLGPTAI